MGVVFQGADPRLDRQVAIKLLAPDLAAGRLAQDRLCREPSAVAAMDHPYICKKLRSRRRAGCRVPGDGIPAQERPYLRSAPLRASLSRADGAAGVRQLNWEERPCLGGSGCQT
jgi:hypothetical protein